MAHQIKDYSSIGGLMFHAKHGADALARSGAQGLERKLRTECRDLIDPDHQLGDVEFEKRFRSYQTAYYKRIRKMRGRRT